MEQIEDGDVDHNVIAVADGESGVLTEGVRETLREFVMHVFEHVPGKRISDGAFLEAAAVQQYIRRCLDRA